tara:strand:+ start:148 stop:711 length:564 start_codon:yes stop_codon:yes gene_type:complete
MKNKELFSIFIRYIILVLIALPNLFLFYFIFTPLTYFPALWFLKYFYLENLLWYDVDGSFFVVKTLAGLTYYPSIIPACVAGAAYYLLTILNLTTPMKISTRIKSLIFILSAFLIFNTVRILYFITLIIKDDFNFFDIAHTATWYFGSTVFVIILWFANVLIFKIKTIPIYTDLRKIVGATKKSYNI